MTALYEQPTSTAAKTGLDKDYVFNWSMGKLETITLLIPNFYGGSSHERLGNNTHLAKALKAYQVPPQQVKQYLQHVPTYWGAQPFTSGPAYFGAVICFLFVLGVCIVEKKYKHWLLAITVLSIVLAWGKNFLLLNDVMYRYLPAYNKFRSVTMTLSMAQVSIVLLACFGLQQLIAQGLTPKIKQGLVLALAITGGISLLSLLFSAVGHYTVASDAQLPLWFVQSLQADRQLLLQQDAFRSLLFIFIAFGILFFCLKKRTNPSVFLGILTLLVVVDYWGIDRRYLNENNFKQSIQNDFFVGTPADRYIKQGPEMSYRVLNLQNPFNEARTSYYHQSIGGYHGAKLGRYQDLINHGLAQEHAQVVAYLQKQRDALGNLPILNMLNAKYFMASHEKEGVVLNNRALGNGWLIQKLITVNSPQEEIETLPRMHTGQEAVIDTSKFSIAATHFNAQGKVTLITYTPNALKYEVEAAGNALAVFSEIYYPKGWQVRIDGKNVRQIRVNYILRALEIPMGKHIVAFTYSPQSYSLGNTISLAASILLGLVMFLAGVFWFYKLRLTHKTQ